MPISNPFKSCTNSTIVLQVQPNMHLESKVFKCGDNFGIKFGGDFNWELPHIAQICKQFLC